MAANNYIVAPPRQFRWHDLDRDVHELILDHTAASFAVERRGTEFNDFPEFGMRLVPTITRYEFKLMRRRLSRGPELEVSISRTLDPAFMQRREWIESDIDEQESLAKRWQTTATFSSISKTIVLLFSEYQGAFKFVRTTPDGAEEVLDTPFWSKFELPAKRNKGILEEVRNNFKTILHMNCVLEGGDDADMARWARAHSNSPPQSDDDYTSSEDDEDAPVFRNWRMP